jgi:hypothetical protein
MAAIFVLRGIFPSLPYRVPQRLFEVSRLEAAFTQRGYSLHLVGSANKNDCFDNVAFVIASRRRRSNLIMLRKEIASVASLPRNDILPEM